MNNGSNRLPVLADEIRRAHADSQRAAQMSVEAAIKAGEALIEAKSHLKHGEWLPWLRDNCELPARTSSHYMRLARHREEIGNAADLTIRGALGAIDAREEVVARIKGLSADMAHNQRELVTHLNEARKTFDDDTDFKTWLAENTILGAEFGERILDLLSREYDETAWTDALLADSEARSGSAG